HESTAASWAPGDPPRETTIFHHARRPENAFFIPANQDHQMARRVIAMDLDRSLPPGPIRGQGDGVAHTLASLVGAWQAIGPFSPRQGQRERLPPAAGH